MLFKREDAKVFKHLGIYYEKVFFFTGFLPFMISVYRAFVKK